METKIKKVIFTGDCHGKVEERIIKILEDYKDYKPSEIAIIIAGDAGINFWLNKTDIKNKKAINEYGCIIYCVRGNHEERPENINTYKLIWDKDICGMVYIEIEFSNIRFLVDGGTYNINGYSVLTIGGAYSIDKWYRLNRNGIYTIEDENYTNAKKTGWFPDEMLCLEEMKTIFNNVSGKHFDFVITHTAPISWEPKDLFLDFVDQNLVDKSMELFLEELQASVDWGIWIFGHYHANRIERPRVEQYFTYFEDMETIWNRWNDKYTYKNEWWLSKSPYMKEWDMENNINED